MISFSNWLDKQDVSVQYTYDKLLCGIIDQEKQSRIPLEGYGKYLLSKQNENGHWGTYYYQPKWTSTHYTLLQLKEIGLPFDYPACQEMVVKMFKDCQLPEGGLNLAKSNIPSDICVDGMILNYSSYFLPQLNNLKKLVLSILSKQKKDGGFTWYDQSNGDPHSTICVLEGLISFRENTASSDLIKETDNAIDKILDFFFKNSLFLSENQYQKFAYPFRYFYSIFRFLLVATKLKLPKNNSLNMALKWLSEKEPTQFIKLEKEYKGQHFLTFSAIGEVNPFLSVYGEYIRNFYM
ncbi:prenyltransferase/squalene oxidase repeat-containing protein [Enterococcus sp. LJL128]